VEVVVLAQPALTPKPAEGPLDNPSAGEDRESARSIRAFDDLDVDRPKGASQAANPIDELAGVRAIGPEPSQSKEALRERCEELLAGSWMATDGTGLERALAETK
jgi:hypothetical protein